jgi:CS domain
MATLNSNNFTFVLIPADESKPIVELQASKEGGLSDDALIQHAKLYFHDLTGANARAAVLEQASETERAALAAQIRQQVISSSNSANNGTGNSVMAERIAAMDDATVIDTLYKSQMLPSCDITALTIPTSTNQYTACSMYAADSAQKHGLPWNHRATELITACGHSPPIHDNGNNATVAAGIYGDVFCGRARDNEMADVWDRADFVTADADPAAEWCRVARSAGGGGGSGGRTAASSLSNLVQSQFQNNASSASASNNVQIINGGSTSGTDGNLFGMNGASPVMESWGSWTQSNDEVELKFAVAAGTKSKYCKVQFTRTALKVTVAGQTLVQGATFDPVSADDCTFTLQDEGPTSRELCVTLSKVETGRTWAFAVR